MVDDPYEIILDHLRKLRDGQMKMDLELKDLKHRVGSIERAIAGIYEGVAHINTRLDRLDDRLERIEDRLNLVDA